MNDDLVKRLRDPDYRLANGNDFEALLRAMMEEAANSIEALEAALRRIAKHDTQAIALDALERGPRTSQMRRKTNE